jgi:hypothetical protein
MSHISDFVVMSHFFKHMNLKKREGTVLYNIIYV